MKKSILTLLILITTYNVNAQDYKFGKVSLNEVKNNVYAKDTSASAVILHKSRKTYFNHEHPAGYVIVTEIHERIKILNKDGLDYGTKEIGLYKSGGDKERLNSIKAYTYNVVNGKLKLEKLKKSGIFKNEVSDNWKKTSFTMPNVKVGSVVEWTYKITSPFWKIDDLIIQADIPTAHYFGKVDRLSYFNFQRIVKGGFSVVPKEYKEPRSLNVSWEQSVNGSLTQPTRTATIQTTEYVSEYELRDVPALKEELYVDNIDNYRFLITYELMSTQFPNSGLKKYSTSWEDVVKTINKSDNFGGQLKKSRFLRDDATRIKSMGTAPLEITNNAFEFVKNKMSWNGKKRVSTRDGLQKAYKENTGNSAQINLILTALLRECGIKANPVLVSTRDNGFPVFPTLDGFNYVVVCTEINGKDILLDATEKLSILGMLPQRALNWEGTLVLEDGRTRKINLYPKKISLGNTIMNITINDDGSIEGKQRTSYTNLKALQYRKEYKKYTKDEYVENLINTYTFDDLVDFEVKNLKDLNKPIMETYTFEFDEGVDVIGNEMYISPLFFLKIKSNPFKLEERNYPVNFVYPQSRKKIINIKIPEGYQVTSLPKPIKVSLPDGMGSFLFNISEVKGGVNVLSTFKINSAIIPAYKYLELKEFYNQRVLKEAEKIVLTKS
jgi:Domain of Unknown Function with PDB structure (DUF3857)